MYGTGPASSQHGSRVTSHGVRGADGDTRSVCHDRIMPTVPAPGPEPVGPAPSAERGILPPMPPTMEVLVSLCKRRGFVFQSSEIYGGTGSCWDYGPLGVELKNNIKRLWWRDFVQRRLAGG